MSRPKLSARQQQVLDFLVTYTAANGFSPCLREIAEELGGVAHTAASDHIQSLQRKGYVERPFGSPRAIRVLPLGEAPVKYLKTVRSVLGS